MIIIDLLLFLEISSQSNLNYTPTFNNTINDLSKFKSKEGIQLYFFNDNTLFVYITIGNKDKSSLTIETYIYFNDLISNIPGYYFALGFGSHAMPDLKIILCGRSSLNKDYCEGYITKGYALYKEMKLVINVKSFSCSDISMTSGLYNTYIKIAYSLVSITSEELEKIYNGKERFSFSYGKLINNLPSKHLNVTANLLSIDGNSNNNQIIIQPDAIIKTINRKKRTLVPVSDRYYYVNERVLTWILVYISYMIII